MRERLSNMKTEGCLEGGFTGAASPAVDNRGKCFPCRAVPGKGEGRSPACGVERGRVAISLFSNPAAGGDLAGAF